MKLKLLPFDNFTIQTHDSIDLVRKKLMSQVRESTSIEESENYFFKGQVSENEFKIDRNVIYGNFDVPTVIGRLESVSEGTVIHVRMKVKHLIHHLLTVLSIGLSGLYLVYGLKELGIWILSGTIYSQILAIASEPLESPLFIIINFPFAIRSLADYWTQFKIDRDKLNQILVDEV